MSEHEFDLFVIGGGSGGVRAGRMAAGFGARVALAEERYLGGTCVNVGCIPKKLLTYAAQYAHDFTDAAAYGWSVPPASFNWATLIANKDREIQRLNGVYRRLLENAGCTILEGRATLVDRHTVEVSGRRYTAHNILIATGGWPVRPNIPGKELLDTSNDVFHYAELPASLVIEGGGYIACELAGIFNGLGSEVTLVHRRHKPLRGFDEDVRDHMFQEMSRAGIRMEMEQTLTAVERLDAGRLRARLSSGKEINAARVLSCIGRRPLTEGLGLDAVGVELDPLGGIPIDGHFRTNVPHIFAVGDVTNRVQLTPVALAEGMAVAYHLFGPEERPAEFEHIPTAVFSDPQVGMVGCTEHEGLERFGRIDVYVTKFRPLKHTLTGRETQSLMKLIVDHRTQRVVGCHVVGSDAAEIVQGVAVAITCHATKKQFDTTLGIHPTAAEELVTMRELSRHVEKERT